MRGVYQNAFHGRSPRALVGLSFFHTPEDAERAAAELDTQWNGLVDAMYRAMGADPSIRRPDDPLLSWSHEQIAVWKGAVEAATDIAKKSPLWPLWESTISPAYMEWKEFLGQRDSGGITGAITGLIKGATMGLLAFSLDDYQRFQDKYKQAYRAAQSAGVKALPPPPLDFQRTVPEQLEDAGNKAAKEASDLLTVLKVGLYAVLGIAGVVAVTSVVTNVRKGHDPLEKYTNLYRGARR